MGAFLVIAWRNVFRNRKRSFITLSAIAFGLMAVIFLWSFVDGFQNQMREGIKNLITGDIQIYPQGAEGLYNANLFLENPEEVRSVLKDFPEISLVVERVVASGIVSSANNSITTFVVGMDPAQEQRLQKKDVIVKGRPIEEGDEHGAVIGAPMAEQLQVDIGDKVVVVMQDRFGGLAAEAFRVVGIFRTGSDQIDHTTVHLLLPVLQRALSLEGEVTKFLVRVPPNVSLEPLMRRLRERLDPARYRISPWEEIAPMLSQLIEFQQRMILIVVSVVLVILSAGMLNTLMMSYVERIREFGLMKALGTKDRSLVFLLTLETAWLTVVGTAVGLSMGLLLALGFGARGIDLSRFGETFSNFLIGTVIYPLPRWEHILTAVLVVLGTNLLVSFYPAWRASRLQPIEAMRQVG